MTTVKTWEGAGVADREITHDGRESLKWELDAGDMVRRIGPFPEADYSNMLAFWVHAERMTGARLTVTVLTPDVNSYYHATFAVEWTGWNLIQLEKEAFTRVGSPSWHSVQDIEFRSIEGPLGPTVLRLGDLQWSDQAPTWDIGGGEYLIEPFYNAQFSPVRRWQIKEETCDPSTVSLGRLWNAMLLLRQRDPQSPSSMTFWRPIYLDISNMQALRVQASLPSDAMFGFSARIDGKMRDICPPEPGRDDWHEYRGQLDGERLEEIYFHCGDRADRLTPASPTRLEYHFHFVTAEGKGFAPPQYPDERPTRPLSGDITERYKLTDREFPAWLYLGRDDIAGLRDKIRAGQPAEMFSQLKKRADGYLDYDPTPYIGDFIPVASHEWLRPWTPTQPWADILETCGLMYVLTDDLRYAEQARRVLLAMAALDKWNYGMVSKYPVGWGGHAGPFCESTAGPLAALAYNWIYNTLTDEERTRVEEAILWKSWYWINDYVDTRNYIRSMNQGPWFNYGALIQAATVAHRYPWLERFYDKYDANMRECISLCYLKDGANTEGASYWAATTRYVVRSLPLLAHISGKPVEDYVTEPLRDSIDLPIYMRSTVSEEFNVLGVNDGNYGPWNAEDAGLFFAAALHHPHAQWAWQETSGKRHIYGDLFFSLLWYQDWGTIARPELSLSKQFSGTGWIVLRSGWEVGDILFSLQSGIWGTGHQHLDKNSFILEAYRERLCPDKGIGRYGDPRNRFLQSTVSHNTITINEGNQVPADPVIRRYNHSAEYDIIESDVSGSYPDAEVVRRVLFRRQDRRRHPNRRGYFVIADEVTTSVPSSIEYNLHTFSEVSVDGDSISLAGREADMLVKVLMPVVFDYRISESRRAPDAPVIRDVQLAPTGLEKEMLYITLLYPLMKGENPPSIASEPDGEALRIWVGDDYIVWDPAEGLHFD